jgi:hypothetical protein
MYTSRLQVSTQLLKDDLAKKDKMNKICF